MRSAHFVDGVVVLNGPTVSMKRATILPSASGPLVLNVGQPSEVQWVVEQIRCSLRVGREVLLVVRLGQRSR